MFQLSKAEKQEVVTNCDHLARLRFSSTLPFAFTEHGSLMHKDLAAKLDRLERKVSGHDKALAGVIDAIRQLMREPEPSGRQIGFTADLGKKRKS